MSNPYLLLWLEAPLQSWGHDSVFGRRESLDFPTKSGVLGLLCCARGEGNEQREWLDSLADLDMKVDAYVSTDKVGQPLPRTPHLKDFHMVGSGYNSKDPWQKLLMPKTSEGKSAVNGGTKMSYRYYLQDMAFAVALQVPKSEAEAALAALIHPTWDLFLGRKCCAPTEFIGQGLYDEAEQALIKGRELAKGKNKALSFKVWQGDHTINGTEQVMRLNDEPVQFGQHKLYRDRLVTVFKEE